MLCIALVLRLALQRQQVKAMMAPIIVGIGLTAASLIAKEQQWLLYYPVVINVSMLALFGYSLKRGPSMIERLARLKEPDLPATAITYLRTVTKLWCGLFIFNGAMAWYTASYATLAVWTWYNGLIAYLLIGAMFAGEWLYRTFWLKNMTELLTSWLIRGPSSQQLISFNHHDIVTGALFTNQVAHIHTQLSQSQATRWLLASDDSALFAAGLCAALLAGKQIVLPNNTQSGTLSAMTHQFDGVLSDQPLCEGKRLILLKKITLTMVNLGRH